MSPDPPVPASERSSRSILAVEDAPDLLCPIRRELGAAGFDVWPAASAEEALELVGRRGEPEPNRPRYVVTERGAGYRFPRAA